MPEPTLAEAAPESGIPPDMIEGEPPAVVADKPPEKDQTATELREILRAQDQRLKDQDKMLREVLERTQRVDERSANIDERQRGAELRGYSRIRADVEAIRDKAASEADMDTYHRANRELSELDKAKPAPAPEKKADAPPVRQEAPPEISDWVDKNKWFNTDTEMKEFAIHWDSFLTRTKPGVTAVKRLEAVAEKTKAEFPDKFENPARKAPSAVATPGAQAARAPPAKKVKTVADLDEDGKAALARFKRLDKKFTDDDYLKAYQWDKT